MRLRDREGITGSGMPALEILSDLFTYPRRREEREREREGEASEQINQHNCIIFERIGHRVAYNIHNGDSKLECAINKY